MTAGAQFSEDTRTICAFDGRRRRRFASSPISPARCSGKSRACWSSPTCIWKRAPASPRAACCCRLTIRWRRSSRLAAVVARHDPRMVIALGDSFHDRDAHDRLSAAGPRDHRGDAGAARLDLDIGQSRSGIAVAISAAWSRAKSRSAESPSAMSRPARTAKSPATCIPRRGWRPAAARWSGAVLPATASAR